MSSGRGPIYRNPREASAKLLLRLPATPDEPRPNRADAWADIHRQPAIAPSSAARGAARRAASVPARPTRRMLQRNQSPKSNIPTKRAPVQKYEAMLRQTKTRYLYICRALAALVRLQQHEPNFCPRVQRRIGTKTTTNKGALILASHCRPDDTFSTPGIKIMCLCVLINLP